MYSHEIQAVLFDLDGTLLDTAHDIATATNHVLVQHAKQSRLIQEIRPYIGNGISSIINNIFSITTNHPKFNLIRQQLLQAYQQIMFQKTDLFPGISDVLSFLQKNKIPWGIITNKPTWLAEPLINQIPRLASKRVLIGRETVPINKPHPLPLHYACQHLSQVSQYHCVYIGDSITDIIAAQAAGMYSIAATYGYIHPQDDPKKWHADYIIETPYDLISWLEQGILEGTSYPDIG